MWLVAAGVVRLVCCHQSEGLHIKAGGDVLQAIRPRIGEDAVEMPPECAVRLRSRYTSRTRWPSIRTFCKWVRAERGHGPWRSRCGGDRAASGKSPAILVGMQGDLHEHGKGVAVLARVEVVDLVAESDRHFGVDDLLGAVQESLRPRKMVIISPPFLTVVRIQL